MVYEKPSKKDKLLLMEEILHQLIGSLSHYLQCFDTSQVVSRISVICPFLLKPPSFCPPNPPKNPVGFAYIASAKTGEKRTNEFKLFQVGFVGC